MTKSRLFLFLAALLAMAGQAQAQADAYPSKPVTIILPFPPGGGADAIGRVLAERLSAALKQPFIVENRSGASGNIGSGAVVAAKPDGYTLLVNNNTIVTNPGLGISPFDVGRDLKAVAMISYAPVVLAVHNSVPVKDSAELIELLRKEPDKWSYSSCGNGTSMHLAGELFKMQAKVNMQHIAYRGCGPAAADGIAGHVPILFNTYNGVAPHQKSGRIRILATASARRYPMMEDVPALANVPGLDNFDADIWCGLFAPASTDPAIVRKLNETVNRILADPEMQAKLRTLSNEAAPMTPEAFHETVVNDVSRWTQLIRSAGIKAD